MINNKNRSKTEFLSIMGIFHNYIEKQKPKFQVRKLYSVIESTRSRGGKPSGVE
jgi:hypothetical protein